jgi:sec-independent protein translocase protein TatA
MEGLGIEKLLFIFLIILIFFGGKKIPELAKGLGAGVREFRKAAKDIQEEINTPGAEPDKKIDPSKEIKHS